MQDAIKNRWAVARKRAVLLASLLGCLGLVGPRQADARRAHKTPGAPPAVDAAANAPRDGSHARLAKEGSKHPRRRGRSSSAVCTAAFEKAKETARDSQLRASSEWFAVCARPGCSRALRQKCAAVQPRVAALLASVVPAVSGAPASGDGDVVVRMDGAILTSSLDGTAILIDPGQHQFTFAKDGEIFANRSLTVERGQRNLLVSAALEAKKSEQVDLSATPVAEEAAASAPATARRRAQRSDQPNGAAADGETAGEEEPASDIARRAGARRAVAESDPRKGAPWSAFTLAGVGLLGVGGYWTFNLKGSADNDALAALCKPDCNPTSVRHVRNLYLAADISLGLGVAALIGSTYLFLRSDSREEESPRARRGPISELSVAPTSSGALATVGGTF